MLQFQVMNIGKNIIAMKAIKYILLLFVVCLQIVFVLQIIECVKNKNWNYIFFPILYIISAFSAFYKLCKWHRL